jgi:opacity protein-like surface antigen
MYKDKCCLLIFMFCFFGFSQVKKVSDTVYVYEEVIVHDTVYVEKPLDKIKIDKVIISPENKATKPQLTIIEPNKKTTISVDTLIIEKKKEKFPWNFGAKFLAGFNSNSLFREFNGKTQPYFGIGIFVKKTLLNPNFAIGIGFESSLSIGNFNFDASQNDSSLNGFYFTDDGSPKLFKSLTNKGFQFQVPVQIYWKIEKFTPSIGVFGNLTNYKSTFIGSSGNLPLALDETQNYSSKAFYFGYLAQLEYQITTTWSVALNYSFANAKKLTFTDNNESFGVSRNIQQHSFGTSLLYQF